MNDFAKPTDSKEFKIKRLNGWLRISVWAILFLVVVGTILGILYWQRTARKEEDYKATMGLVIKAMQISDSLDIERHNQVMEKLDRVLEMHRRPLLPEEPVPRLDTANLKKRLMEQKPKEKK